MSIIDRAWTHNDYTDYTKHWPNVTDYSLRDLTWQSNRHNTNQSHMQGVFYYGISILIPKCNEICPQNKRQNTRTKIIQRWYKMHNYIPHMSDIGPYKACNVCIDLLGNTHPLKVDRNLQWMSHHPTNPTYYPVLSGTMTHLSAQYQNSTTKTHNINTYTQKVCISHLAYCVSTFWKCDYSTCGPKCNRPPK